ncbi:hypothetical protein SpCBS45565_g04587 [Spizellomyces sp. 'palustris']|nr:hypothetical protein SpCBS45565_g04587 [Spizellomyces sp. 'palustris']
MTTRVYKEVMHEFAKVSAHAPKGRAPKLYNYHRYLKGPFQDPSSTQLHHIPLANKSAEYATSGLPPTSTSVEGDQQPQELQQKFRTDIPLPNIITRHIHLPSPTLDAKSAIGKITGFRIEVTGRRGTRSSTQRFAYGKLGTGNVGGAYVDFARSLYVHKKGATGIKVWIGYGR